MEDLKRLLGCSDERLFPDPYNFSFGRVDDLAKNRLAFESNFVRTSKYRWYNFLPSNVSSMQNLSSYNSNASPTSTS